MLKFVSPLSQWNRKRAAIPSPIPTAPQYRKSAECRQTRSVLVVGGGLAGLAAASALSRQGIQVTLLESRPILGGRTSSFRDAQANDWVDNCQHVGMGCCTNWQHFCQSIGIDSCLATQTRLYFQDRQGRRGALQARRWPAPFHLAEAFLRLPFFSTLEKLRLAYGVFQMCRQPASDLALQHRPIALRDWLLKNGQTEALCDQFWGTICTSALNESLDRIDYKYGRQVLLQGFLAHYDAWQVQIPTQPLAKLYGPTLITKLQQQGVTVILNEAAQTCVLDGDQIDHVISRSGKSWQADAYLLAVPHYRLVGLFADLPENPLGNLAAWSAWLQRSQSLGTVPITSVHLWWDRVVLDRPNLVLLNHLAQWVFPHPQSHLPNLGAANQAGQYIQVVISASRQLEALSKSEIQSCILTDLRRALPASAQAKLLHARVVTERRATFSITPGVDDRRLTSRTPIPNLYLAGDHIRTGWPATMEGATRSGYLAAEAVLAAFGKPVTLLQPDLPISPWLKPILKAEQPALESNPSSMATR